MRPSAHSTLNWAIAAGLLVSVVCAWAAQTSLTRDFYGQDSALYAMVGARLAAGDTEPLWNGYLAPGVPVLIGLLVKLGASVTFSFHAVALMGYLWLIAAVTLFSFSVSRTLGLDRRTALSGALVFGWLFSMAADVVLFCAQPLTDPFTLAAFLTGVGLLGLVPSNSSTWGWSGVGVTGALSYLFRFASLPMALLLVLGGIGALAWRLGRRELTIGAFIRLGSAVAAPLVLALIVVVVSTSGAERGFSFGMNSQTAANMAVARDLHGRKQAEAECHRVLNDDGTFGFYHADPGAPDAWNVMRWMSQVSYTSRAGAGGRLTDKLAHPAVALKLATTNFMGAARYHGRVTVAIGALLWLTLLWRVRRRAALHMWIVTAAAAVTLAGGLLMYFGESRYLWLPVIVSLSALPSGAVLAWRDWREPHFDRRVALLGVAAIGIAAAVWVPTTVVGFSEGQGLVGSLRAQRASGQAAVDRAVAQLLAPARDDAEAERAAGDLPFTGVTVASFKTGHALAASARWLPLPLLSVTGAEWDAASPAQQATWLARAVDFLRRGHARYVVLTARDYDVDPTLRPLFGSDLPAGITLLGDVPGRDSAAAARVLRVTDVVE